MNTSIAAYKKPENIKTRWTHRQMILNSLERLLNGLTSREIAEKVRLSHSQVWKRCSDLLNEKKIIICGEKLEGKNYVWVYKLNPEPGLFTDLKPKTFRQFAIELHPELEEKYNHYLLSCKF